MSDLSVESVAKVFESKPIDAATWLVSLESIAAIQRVLKQAKVVELPEEIAAHRVIRSLGNGDYDSVSRYFVKPEIYPPGMVTYAHHIGARSVRGNLDPALMAVLTYKTNKQIRSQIDHGTEVFSLHENAGSFRNYFVTRVSNKVDANEFTSMVDITLGIKNDTALWIDR